MKIIRKMGREYKKRLRSGITSFVPRPKLSKMRGNLEEIARRDSKKFRKGVEKLLQG